MWCRSPGPVGLRWSQVAARDDADGPWQAASALGRPLAPPPLLRRLPISILHRHEPPAPAPTIGLKASGEMNRARRGVFVER